MLILIGVIALGILLIILISKILDDGPGADLEISTTIGAVLICVVIPFISFWAEATYKDRYKLVLYQTILADEYSKNTSLIKFGEVVKIHEYYYDTPWYYARGGTSTIAEVVVERIKQEHESTTK